MNVARRFIDYSNSRTGVLRRHKRRDGLKDRSQGPCGMAGAEKRVRLDGDDCYSKASGSRMPRPNLTGACYSTR